MSNSYKPALLRSLAHYGSTGNTELVIPWSWLGGEFLKYYWPLAIQYRIRQTTVAGKEPLIMTLIRNLNVTARTKLSDFKKKNRHQYDEVIQSLASPRSKYCCFKDVIPRFHTVRRRGPKTPLYSYVRGNDFINLHDESLSFLRDNHETLRLLAIGRWVRFTEQYSNAPRLWEKIENKTNRKPITRYRNALLQSGMVTNCFYCRQPIGEEWHVDHFLPWSFVLEHSLWNLVPSCAICNGQKSDRIPVNSLGDLFTRNRVLQENENFTDHFKEWTIQALEQHITLLRDAALAEGFEACN
jgi:5-methylcytosine-specific restriction endonuclease McrA